jgi:membrane associated rhomboid family serine protease
LPDTKTADFTPVITESADFAAALTTLTPKPYVTPSLIGINVLMFIIATVLGGGLIKVNPDVMIGLGTDYTPLTMGGQWWRLLTSVFLHFGLLHVAFNMLALYVNGLMAERIFGSVRYLVIYLAHCVIFRTVLDMLNRHRSLDFPLPTLFANSPILEVARGASWSVTLRPSGFSRP